MALLSDLLTSHLSVLATWVAIAAVLGGVGLLVPRGRLDAAWGGDALFIAFWLGFALLLLYLQLWHLVWPVTALAGLLPLVLGITGLWLHRPVLRRVIKRLLAHPKLVLILAVAALWCANQATGPGNAHDSGLYHYNVIRWNNEHALTPGLGNLHIRLAFNNASLLYSALVNTGPWAERGNHIGNGMLLMVLMIQSLVGLGRCLRADGAPRATDLFLAFLLPVSVMLALSKEMSSAKTDLPLAAVTFVGMWRLIALANASSAANGIDRTLDFLTVTTLASAGVCLKLSGTVHGLACWLVALAIYLGVRPQPTRMARPIVAAVILSTLLVGPWMVRGTLLTGQPLFPTQIARYDVPWRVPNELVETELEGIAYFSRLGIAKFVHGSLAKRGPAFAARWTEPPTDTEAALDGLGWVRPWFFAACFYTPMEVVVPLLLLAATALLALGMRFFPQNNPTPRPPPWLHFVILVAPAVGAIFWFSTAPEARFGYGILWTLAAASASLACENLFRTNRVGTSTGGIVLTTLLASLALVAVGHRAAINRVHLGTTKEVGPYGGVPFVVPGPDRGFHPIPVTPMVPWTSRWGLTLQVPENLRDGTKKQARHLTWDAPLPCTGFPHPFLRLRKPGSLGSGFVIDTSMELIDPRWTPWDSR